MKSSVLESPKTMPHSSLRSTSSLDGMRTRMSLLGRARDGSSDLAWEELLKFYQPFVAKVLGSMGFRGENLNDAQQQVYLKLWKGLKTYERDPERARFRTWFARLIKNTALNIIRSKKRQPDGPSLDDESFHLDTKHANDHEIELEVEKEWQLYLVGLAMDRARSVFSGNAVEVFELSLQGKSVEEISSQLHVKPNTVYILKHRVKTMLLKEIHRLKTDLETFGERTQP